MPAWLQEIDCTTPEEFLNEVVGAGPRWLRSQAIGSEWLHRGMGNADWQLLPSLWRPLVAGGDLYTFVQTISQHAGWPDLMASYEQAGNKLITLVSQPLVDELKSSMSQLQIDEREQAFLAQWAVELRLLHDFWQICDSVGHAVDPPEWVKLEMSFRDAVVKPYLTDDLFSGALAATAQHHGVPTRLLDWTTRPLVAAFFAAENPSGDQIAVWSMPIAAIRKTRLQLHRPPRYRLPNLHAQAGCFVWDVWPFGHFCKYGEFPSQESAFGEAGFTVPTVRKIKLPKEKAGAVIAILWKEGVSRAHLMPNFDNAARSLLTSMDWRDPAGIFDDH